MAISFMKLGTLADQIIYVIFFLGIVLAGALSALNPEGMRGIVNPANKKISIAITLTIIFLIYQGCTIFNKMWDAGDDIRTQVDDYYRKELLYVSTKYQLETGKPTVTMPYTLDEEKLKEMQQLALDRGYELKPGRKIAYDKNNEEIYVSVEKDLLAVKKNRSLDEEPNIKKNNVEMIGK